MKFIAILFFTILVSGLLSSCESETEKPKVKPAQYPTNLFGAWEWPCSREGDTKRTEAELYKQQKRVYGPNSEFTIERTMYKDSNCTAEPLAKGIFTGTYNIVRVVTEHPTNLVPYVEINYKIDNLDKIVYEGDKLIAVSTDNSKLRNGGLQFFGIANVFPDAGQLHIGGFEGGFEEDVLLRPEQFDDYLTKSIILQPAYLPVPTYNTTSIMDLVGTWTENCYYEDNIKGVDYYSSWKVEIIADGNYQEINGLYSNATCTGPPISHYTYPGTIAVNTAVGQAGISPTNVGANGLNVTLNFGTRIQSISTSQDVPNVLSSLIIPSTERYSIMIADPASTYRFFNDRWEKNPTDVIHDISVRVTSAP